jgi:hypothetical protein
MVESTDAMKSAIAQMKKMKRRFGCGSTLVQASASGRASWPPADDAATPFVPFGGGGGEPFVPDAPFEAEGESAASPSPPVGVVRRLPGTLTPT